MSQPFDSLGERALRLLRDEGQPMSLGMLALRLGRTTSAVQLALEPLFERGEVRRSDFGGWEASTPS